MAGKTDPYGSLRGNRTPSFGIRIMLSLSISRSLIPSLFRRLIHGEYPERTDHVATLSSQAVDQASSPSPQQTQPHDGGLSVRQSICLPPSP
jgi:hypothetical protein